MQTITIITPQISLAQAIELERRRRGCKYGRTARGRCRKGR